MGQVGHGWVGIRTSEVHHTDRLVLLVGRHCQAAEKRVNLEWRK